MPGSFIPTIATLLGYFDVSVYGAKADNATDVGPAVQAAANAAIAQGGGVVYFPPGRYYWLTPVTLAPRNATTQPSVAITFKGSWNPNLLEWGDPSLAAQAAGGMSTVRSNANFVSGAGWLINVPTSPGSILYGFSAISVFLEDLALETYSNPAVGFINAQYAVNCSVKRVIVMNAGRNDETIPTNTGNIAIVMPQYANGAVNRLEDVLVNGHYAGISLGDQITHTGLAMFSACNDALLFNNGSANQHMLTFDRLLVQYCVNGLTFTSPSRVIVNCYDAERHNDLTGYEVNDPGNNARGVIRQYNMGTAGAGTIGTFGKNGGNNLICTSI